MKVLCINSNGLRNDGITNCLLEYYSNMDLSDMQVDMLKTAYADPAIEKRVRDAGIGLVETTHRKKVISYIFKTAKLIHLKEYDIVHVHGSSAILSIELLAAKAGGCKIRIAHSRNTKCNHPAADRLLRPLFNMLCTERYACGKDAGEWLFGNKEFTVIKNGKDFDKFRFDIRIRNEIREKYDWHKKIIGHVGNFNYQKNHEFLLNLFAELIQESKEYQLILVGTGQEYLKKAQNLVRKLGIEDSVVFLGSIHNVAEVLQGMDIMLLPSRFEGLPNVVLEWQISGLPSIVSDMVTRECGVTELVQYLPVDQGTKSWIDAIRKTCITDDRAGMSDSACRELRKAGYDIKDNAKRLKEQYKLLVEKNADI